MNNPGDLVITRNSDVVGNDTPGYWNHAAISDGNFLIEAQATANAVIKSTIEEFKARYPEFTIFRHVNADVGHDAAKEATTFIGVSYRKFASLFVFLRRRRRGENCVTLVRKAYKKALGFDPGWKVPDDILTFCMNDTNWYIVETRT